MRYCAELLDLVLLSNKVNAGMRYFNRGTISFIGWMITL